MNQEGQVYPRYMEEDGVFVWTGGTPENERLVRFMVFRRPVRILSLEHPCSPSDMEVLFQELEKGLASGFHAAGWLAYEAGYLLDPKLAPLADSIDPGVPLVWFGLYDGPLESEDESFQKHHGLDSPCPDRSCAISLAFDTTKEEFVKDVERIHSYIRSGDTYQINYTIRGRFESYSRPYTLFRLLRQRQKTAYGAFIRPGDGFHVLSLSPELFFARHNGKIWSRPMKGTAARGKDGEEDTRIAELLKNDEKNRAENVMIVDLLRNDLGMVCNTGSVKVPELFTIEGYETLFQMTSTVEGTLRRNTRWIDVFRALFPCGSITGAPKIRSMEIIAELEKSPRGIYTGAIGYIRPDNSAIFNVAIRTATMRGGSGELGIGAGITMGSDPEEEYEETVLKARFLTVDTE